MQEGDRLKTKLCIMLLYYVMLCVMLLRLGKKGLVTMNNWKTILGIHPKFGLSNLRSKTKILETD